MIRLLISELRRLLSRRMLLWTFFVMVGLVVTIVVINTVQSNASSFNARDAIRTTDLWLRDSDAQRLGVAARNRIAPISVICYLMVVALGASAIGAEYRAGTVTTILTWEPRRTRLLAVRLGAVALVSMGFFVVILGVMVAGWAFGAALRGSSGGADAEFWRELVTVLARGTILAGVLGVLSGALATLGRNTAAALGIWFGYLIAIEAILQSQVKATTPWMLTLNAAAVYSWERVRLSGHSISAGAGALHLAAYLVVVGGAAFVAFARRDVT